MEASELRIGNFIIGTYESEDDNLMHETICEFKFYNCYDNYYWVESEDLIEDFTGFKPIPITEEWLLKFGFEYINECNEIKELVFKINDWLKIYFNDEDSYKSGCLFVGIEETDIGSSKAVDIESVHQLQNLFFALTGEELKLIH